MAEVKDKILLIVEDAEERATLIETALEPFGYDVRATDSGDSGLVLIHRDPPDVLVLDLHLKRLSGRDVITALNAQAYDIPVILLANEGAEREALQAFRLGARDYVVRPIRETELVQAIERALKEVRLRREREKLLNDLRQTAAEAKRHLDELRTLTAIGKAVAALRNLNEIFDSLIRAAVQLTRAEAAGLFLKDEQTGALILRAGQSLTRELEEQLGKPVEDDLAALVMSSRQTYMASGEGLKRFNPAQKGATAVIYAPLVVHDAAIGLIWVSNTRLPFADYMKDLLTALADYAAIAIVNARLFATMHERTRQLEEIARRATGRPMAPAAAPPVADLVPRLRSPLTSLLGNMNMFRKGEMGKLPPSLQAAVDVMHRQLEELIDTLDSAVPPDTGGL